MLNTNECEILNPLSPSAERKELTEIEKGENLKGHNKACLAKRKKEIRNGNHGKMIFRTQFQTYTFYTGN